jgi:RHS repeat-associated protein
LEVTVDASVQSTTPDWQLTFYSYDADGRLARKDRFVPGVGQVTLTYRRDRQGRITRRKTHLHQTGKAFYQFYEYNRRGQVTAVYASTSSSKPSDPEVSYSYGPDGQVTSTDWTGTSSIQRRYNARGWLTGIGDRADPSAFAAGYAYYADGNVKADTSNPKGDADFARSYRYDALDRLRSADYGADDLGGAYDLEGLRYDPNGNIRGLTRYGQGESAVDDLTYSYENNRLTQVADAVADTSRHGWDAGSGTFRYDAAGRMLRAPAPTGLEAASYDRQGLPEAMALKGGQTLRYRYSAAGQRTYKQRKGQGATHYVRDGSATMAVLEGADLQYWTLTLPGGETIGRVKADGSRRYYVKDHLGSVRAVLGGSGGVKETRDYYPFGLPMPGRYDKGSPPTKEDFTGHVKDTETGLHYAGARYYSGAFARWLGPDPILGEKPPKKLLKQDPRLLTMTSYNYTFNNPARLTDPDGKAPCCILPLGFEDVVQTAQAMFGSGESQQRAQQSVATRVKARAGITVAAAGLSFGGTSALYGALAGGGSKTALDAGTTALTQYGNGNSIDLSTKNLAGSFVQGATFGAALGPTSGLSNGVQGLTISLSAGGLGNVGGGILNRSIRGEAPLQQGIMTGDFISGALGAAPVTAIKPMPLPGSIMAEEVASYSVPQFYKAGETYLQEDVGQDLKENY